MKPTTGQAPTYQNTIPPVRLKRAMMPMRMAKPAGAKDRCGEIVTEKTDLSMCASLSILAFEFHGQGPMARLQKLKPEATAEVFRRFEAATPEPKGELQSVNAYTLLVAVVLSA